MNIPTEVQIAIALNNNFNSNLNRFSFAEIKELKSLINDHEFELAEKKMAKVNLLTTSQVHRMIKHFMSGLIFA